MRDVDDEDVHAGANQFRGTLEVVARCADRRADTQAALIVARRKRQPSLVHQVPRGDQPDQPAVVVDERQLLDLALHHRMRSASSATKRTARCSTRRSSGVMRSDTWCIETVHEPHVPFGEQAQQPAVVVDDHERADPRSRHQRRGLGKRGVRPDAVRIPMTPCCVRLTILDLAHLRIDLAGTEAAIDDADAALFGLDDGHRRARHRVHVGRDDRPLQRDASRQLARQIDGGRIAADEHAALRRKDEVVERAAADHVEDARPVAGSRSGKGHCGSDCGLPMHWLIADC